MSINRKHKFPKSTYDLELNEVMVSEDDGETLSLSILKVPGGWIYYNTYLGSTGVFVPFNVFIGQELEELDEEED